MSEVPGKDSPVPGVFTVEHGHVTGDRMRRSILMSGLGVSAALALAVAAAGPAAGSAPVGSASNPVLVRKSRSDGFSPRVAVVAPGAVVHFRNVDHRAHNVVHRTGGTPLFLSGAPTKRDFTVRAPRRPGRYAYACVVHTFMHGTLVVRR